MIGAGGLRAAFRRFANVCANDVRGAWEVVRARRRAFASALAVFVLLTLLAFTQDRAVDEWVLAHRADFPAPGRAAHYLRWWGRGHDTIFFVLLLLLWSALRRDGRWARYARACALAMIVAGIAINVVRVGSGRPRPRANLPDRWRGPTLIYAHQSFPSGHTSASFASAACMVMAAPPLGVAALASAAGVGWSSIYSRAHHLSDVVAGVGAGSLIGAAFGLAARRRAVGRAPPAQHDPRGVA